jgi:cobalt-zinc-cadmium efflux system membrane fusion protein
MYLNAVIELGGKPVDVLPEKAIINFEGKPYIFIADGNNHFRMLEISTGIHEYGYTEVVLPANVDKSVVDVVVNGAYSLLSKLKNSEEEE